MSEKRDQFIQWVRDAHAMEKQAETMLNAQSNRIEKYPELRSRIEQHLTETQSQSRRLEECLSSLGESTSTVKDTAGTMTAVAQGIGGMFVGDEVVKGAMAGYTFEHFEISAYNALIAAAEECGEPQAAELFRDIRREEEAMAASLAELLPGVTAQYLQREEAGVSGKR